MGGKRNQEFSFREFQSEMPITHVNGDIRYAAGQTNLEFRRETEITYLSLGA